MKKNNFKKKMKKNDRFYNYNNNIYYIAVEVT